MKKILVVLLSALIFFACDNKIEEQSVNESNVKKIASVNYPLHFFVTQIGGSMVDALYPIPAGVDPAYWEPAADDIILYQEADLILFAANVSIAFPELPNTISEGFIEVGGVTHEIIPLPFKRKVAAKLWLVFVDGTQIEILGDKPLIELLGKPIFIEEY